MHPWSSGPNGRAASGMITPSRRLELAQERLLLKRQPELCVVGKGAVVRAGVELDSEVLVTLPRGDVVVVAEERYLGSKQRARIVKPVCGWVSRRCVGVNEEIEHEDDVQVCVAFDGAYAPLLELWLEHFEPIALARPATMLHVLCLDEDAEDALRGIRLRFSRLRVGAYRAALPNDALLNEQAIGRQMRRLAHIWRARLDFVTTVALAAPVGAPVIHSDVDAFWISDPIPDLQRRRKRKLKAGVQLATERPVAAFSRDFGAWFQGAKSFGLCPGFYCVWRTDKGVDLLREWREKLGPETIVSDDQKAINDVYDADTIRAHRDFIVLPYDKYARCKRGHPTKGVPCVWHPYMERTFPPTPVADKVAVMGSISRQLRLGDTSTLDAFHGLLEAGDDKASAARLEREKLTGRRPFLTADFLFNGATGAPEFGLRSSVPLKKQPRPKGARLSHLDSMLFEKSMGARMQARLFQKVNRIRDEKRKIVDEARRAAEAEEAAAAEARRQEEEANAINAWGSGDDDQSYDELKHLNERSALSLKGRATSTDHLARLYG